MSCDTQSHMCGSWFLPRLLFRGALTDVHGLLHGSGDALGLPIHYEEIIQLDGMPCTLGMVKD